MLKKKKGFTLVELLIVIVVIGVLSAMMMLSSTEAVSSAKVSNVINNMRNIKTATLEWYMDHIDYVFPDKDDQITYKYKFNNQAVKRLQNLARNDPNEIKKYLNNGDNLSLNEGVGSTTAFTKAHGSGTYAVVDGTGGPSGGTLKEWYVVYSVPNDNRMKEKFAARAQSLELLKNATEIYDKNAQYLYMKIIDFKNH